MRTVKIRIPTPMTDQTTTPTVSEAQKLADLIENAAIRTKGCRQLYPHLLADQDFAVLLAALRAMPEAQGSEKVRLLETKIYLLGDDHGLCIGGRFDGWKCWRHPDGEWVTVKKLDCVQPTFGLAPPPQEVK